MYGIVDFIHDLHYTFVTFAGSAYFMREVFPYWVAFVVSPIIMNFIVRRMYR